MPLVALVTGSDGGDDRISHTYEDLSIGDTASVTRVVTPDDLYVFAHVSGNLNPLHLPGSRAR